MPKSRFWRWMAWIGACLSICVVLIVTYRYNMEFNIGVNHGIMSIWFAIVDLPLDVAVVSAFTWSLLRMLHPTGWARACALLVLQAALTYALIDLHYWRYPSPVLEGSWSDLWSRILG